MTTLYCHLDLRFIWSEIEFSFWQYLDLWSRCRFSKSSAGPILFVKYDYKLLNTLDIEKQVLNLKEPIATDQGCNYIYLLLLNVGGNWFLLSWIWNLILLLSFFLGITYWIDVSPTNENLLATCGRDLNLKIYDQRFAKIVQVFGTVSSSKEEQLKIFVLSCIEAII
mgnify:CR=1 FL=1